MRRVPLLLALAVARTAWAHDPEFTAAQIETLRAATERIQKALGRGGLTAEEAWTIDLSGLDAHDLEHAADEVRDLPDAAREALRLVCRTTVYRRGPVGRLQGARDICYLLGSPREADWLSASRLLRREPLTEDLDRAVVALGRDGRATVRLIAFKLAISLTVFGRNSEGLLATVIAGLTDDDPNVAAATMQDAPNTRDTRVIDRMVACLADDRALNPQASSYLHQGGWKRVSDVLAQRLSWAFFMERRALWKPGPTLNRAGQPMFVLLAPDEVRAWWKENRDAFGFGVPAPQWRCVFDDVVVVDVGKPTGAVGAGGLPLKIDLRTYKEGWVEGRPATTVEGALSTEIRSEECHLSAIGNPDHDDGFVAEGRRDWRSGNGQMALISCRTAFLPTDKPGRVRIKLAVHIGHETGD